MLAAVLNPRERFPMLLLTVGLHGIDEQFQYPLVSGCISRLLCHSPRQPLACPSMQLWAHRRQLQERMFEESLASRGHKIGTHGLQ